MHSQQSNHIEKDYVILNKYNRLEIGACLAVQAQQHNHNEEENGPDRGERHHGDGAWICNEGQTRTWAGGGVRTCSVSVAGSGIPISMMSINLVQASLLMVWW